MSYGRQYAWHTAVTVATTVLTGVLFYALRIVLFDNRLTIEEYGLFYSVYSFAMVIQPLFSFGFDPGLVPHITQFREEGNPAAIKNVVAGAVVVQLTFAASCAILAIAATPFIAHWFPSQPDLGFLIGLLAVHALGVVLFKAGQQFFLGMQALVWRNATDVVRAVVCVSVAFLLVGKDAAREEGILAGVKGVGLAYLLAAFGAVVTQVSGLGISFPSVARARFQWRGDLVRHAFDGGWYLSLAFGGIAVFSSLDTIMITLVRGDLLEVAAFQIALPTAMIIYSLLTAAGLTFMPMARTLWLRGEREVLADGINHIYEAAFALIIITGVLMAAFSDVLMHLLFGADIMNAPEAFNVLAIAGVFFFIAYLNLHILAGIGQARAAAVVIIIALVLDLVLDIPLIYFFGIRGAALASFVGYLVAAILSYRSIRVELPVAVPLKTAGVASLLAAVAWILCHFFRATNVFTTHGVISASAVSGALIVAVALVLEVTGCARLRELAQIILPKGIRAR